MATLYDLLLTKDRPDLIKEFVLSEEQKINSEYRNINQVYTWKCAKGHKWQASLKKRLVGRGCPVCSGRVVVKGINDLATKHPSLVQEWDYKKNKNITPDAISAGSGKKVWWKCNNGHSWEDTVNHRTDGRGCPYCGNKKIIVGVNDFATTHANLLPHWDHKKNQIKPTQVVGGSSKKVWWLCPNCKASYRTSLVSKTRFKTKCPFCKT